MKKLLRVLSVITSIILLVVSQPTYASASNSSSAQAFWDSAPSTGTVYYEDVMERLIAIQSYLEPGKYWNHVGCSSYDKFTTTEHPCGVTAPDWYDGTDKGYHDYEHEGDPCNFYSDGLRAGEQCYGFALLVSNGIFGTSPYSDDWEYGTVDTIRVGDFVRYRGHSFVVAWIDDNHEYMSVYDCNAGEECKIQIRTASQSDYYFSNLKNYTWVQEWDLTKNFIRHCRRNTGEHRPSSTISRTVTFRVLNGSWNDGTTADKVVTLSGPEGSTLSLSSEQIPAVGSRPDSAYKAGSWNRTPTAGSAITSNITYTYSYEIKPISYHTVTFKVVNGSWNDGTTADKNVILNGYEGETITLSASDIPAVGSRPGTNYKAGSWNVIPTTSTSITGNTTYTYTYAVNTNASVNHTVSFYIDGEFWKTETVQDGTPLPEIYTILDPGTELMNELENDGYYISLGIDGWYTNAAGTTRYDFYVDQVNLQPFNNTYRPVTTDLTLYGWRQFPVWESVVHSDGSVTNYGQIGVCTYGKRFTSMGYGTYYSSLVWYIDSELTTKLIDAPDSYFEEEYYGLYYRDPDENTDPGNNSGLTGDTGSGNNSGSTGDTGSGNSSGTTGDSGTGNNNSGSNAGNTGNSNSSSTGSVSTSSNSSVVPALSYEDRGYLHFNLNFGGTANNYELFRQVQGKLYQEVLKFFMPAGYYELYSVNILENGSVVRDEKQGTMSFIIPEGDRKVGRKYIIFAVDKNGVPHVYYDLDNSDSTITAIIDFEGYAFSVLYTD